MKVKIQIDTQTFVRFWLVVIGFGLLGFMIYSARTGLVIIGTALFLALALNGPVSKLARHLPGKSRASSTAISYVVIVLFLGAFMFLAVPPIIQQTAKFAQTVPDLVENATTQWQSLKELIDEYNLQSQVDQATASIRDNATQWASSAGTNVLSGVGSIFGFFSSLFLTLVLSFLMLVEGPRMMRKIWGLYQENDVMDRHRRLANRMSSVVSGYVTGQLTVSALDGLFAGIVVFVISLIVPAVPANLAVTTAALMFIFSLIPLFGALIGALIVSLLLVFNSVPAAVIFAIYFVIYQQLENNFISPAIQSKRLELSPLLVLSAVTIGIYVFGIAGAIISIPIAGCLKVLVEEYLESSRKRRVEKTTPLHKLTKKLANDS